MNSRFVGKYSRDGGAVGINRGLRTEIISEVGVFLRWAISAVLDAAFLVSWVYVQYVADTIIQSYSLSGVDQFQLVVFKVLFVITTLAPVAAYVVVDVVRIFLQARRMIMLEKQQVDDIGGQ